MTPTKDGEDWHYVAEGIGIARTTEEYLISELENKQRRVDFHSWTAGPMAFPPLTPPSRDRSANAVPDGRP
jgi:hypothetical protein